MTLHQAPIATSKAVEFEFSRSDFRDISEFAHKNFGLSLADSKYDLVYSRLIRRIRALGLSDYSSYRSILNSAEGANEQLNLLSALTTNVTHFFRESHHFDTLRNSVLPPLLEAAKAGKKIRIWSTGCSSGQEPYSIALTILDMCPNAAELDIKILATDIDPVVVKKAEQARYSEQELAPVPDKLRNQNIHFDTDGSGMGEISDSAKQLVVFGVLNLIKPLPISGPLDAIFCRNVAIYFDKETQQHIWQAFEKLLAPGGYLFIGHSERLSGPNVRNMKSVGITTYQKPR